MAEASAVEQEERKRDICRRSKRMNETTVQKSARKIIWIFVGRVDRVHRLFLFDVAVVVVRRRRAAC